MHGGAITGNHTEGDGGGIFADSTRIDNPLINPEAVYPRIRIIAPNVAFSGNVAGGGGFAPPSNYYEVPIVRFDGELLTNHNINYRSNNWRVVFRLEGGNINGNTGNIIYDFDTGWTDAERTIGTERVPGPPEREGYIFIGWRNRDSEPERSEHWDGVLTDSDIWLCTRVAEYVVRSSTVFEALWQPAPIISPTPSPTLRPSPTPSIAPSPSPTPSIVPTLTPSPTPSPALTPTPSSTPSPALTPTPNLTPSPTSTLIPNEPSTSSAVNYTDQGRRTASAPNRLDMSQRPLRPDPLPLPIPPPDEEGRWTHYWFIQGYPEGDVRADGFMTRAEMAAMFFNLSTSPDKLTTAYNAGFTDVNSGDWHFRAINYAAVRHNALSGFPDGSFRPNQHITNAEFAAFATGFFNLRQLAPKADFADQFDHWAVDFIAHSFDTLWFDYFGYDYVFRPDAPITRSIAVTLVNHYTGRVPDSVQVNSFLQGRVLYHDITSYNHWAFYEIMIASVTHDFTRDTNNRPVWDKRGNWWMERNTRLLGNWWFFQ